MNVFNTLFVFCETWCWRHEWTEHHTYIHIFRYKDMKHERQVLFRWNKPSATTNCYFGCKETNFYNLTFLFFFLEYCCFIVILFSKAYGSHNTFALTPSNASTAIQHIKNQQSIQINNNIISLLVIMETWREIKKM